MSKQLESLFQDFLTMSTEEQEEKIKQVRHTRTIERPKAAVKRRKKEAKKTETSKTSLKKLASGMSEEEKQKLKALLKG